MLRLLTSRFLFPFFLCIVSGSNQVRHEMKHYCTTHFSGLDPSPLCFLCGEASLSKKYHCERPGCLSVPYICDGGLIDRSSQGSPHLKFSWCIFKQQFVCNCVLAIFSLRCVVESPARALNLNYFLKFLVIGINLCLPRKEVMDALWPFTSPSEGTIWGETSLFVLHKLCDMQGGFVIFLFYEADSHFSKLHYNSDGFWQYFGLTRLRKLLFIIIICNGWRFIGEVCDVHNWICCVSLT